MTKTHFNKITLISLVFLLASCSSTEIAKKSEVTGSLDHIKTQLRGLPEAEGPFEGPKILNASRLLPANVLSGPDYRVEQKVFNDGFLNIYTIDSAYGKVSAVSTARLYKRIHEMKVIAEIEKMNKGKEFAKGVAEKGKDVVKGAYTVVTSPIKTITGAVSGVGKIFKRVGENLGNRAHSDQESKFKSMIGYSKTKRDYANQLKIDVYSRNPLLQSELEGLTTAGYTGNMLSSLAIGTFTGPFVSATGATNLLNKVMKDMSPPDLRRMNREKLKKMRVPKNIADAFIKNGSYTPREQTILVNTMFEMKNTIGRENFIKFATRADHYDVTYFRQLQAEMYADHNRNKSPIKQFINIGPFTSAITADHTINVCLPMDYLLWTSDMAKAATILTNKVNALPWVRKKHMYFKGSISPLARKNLTKLGWSLTTG